MSSQTTIHNYEIKTIFCFYVYTKCTNASQQIKGKQNIPQILLDRFQRLPV